MIRLSFRDGVNRSSRYRLACGFKIGVVTVWRYVREAISLLAASADDLNTAMNRTRLLVYTILDGTLILIDRSPIRSPTIEVSITVTA